MIKSSRISVKDTFELLKLSPRRYYRWKKNYEDNCISGLADQDTGPNLPYNKILPEEREAIFEAADDYRLNVKGKSELDSWADTLADVG